MIYPKKSMQIFLLFFLAVLISCAKNDPQPESQTGCFIRYTNDNREYSYDCGIQEEFNTNADFSNYNFPEKDESGRYIFWSSLANYIKVGECLDCDQYKSIMESSSVRKPPSRMYHELIFHKETETIILLGGQTVPAFGIDLHDVWAYWIDDNFWESIGIYKPTKNMTSGAMSPAYDEESNRIIAFNADGETWSFHLEELEWERF